MTIHQHPANDTAAQAARGSGIKTHSTETPYKSYAIFAVGNDLTRVAAFCAWAVGRFPYLNVQGRYKGETEPSFLCSLEDFWVHVDGTPWIAGQETVLLLDPAYRHGMVWPHRRAYLLPVDAAGFMRVPGQYIGLLGELPREQALERDDYSYVGGKFWGTLPGTGSGLPIREEQAWLRAGTDWRKVYPRWDANEAHAAGFTRRERWPFDADMAEAGTSGMEAHSHA